MAITDAVHQAVLLVPDSAWMSAVEPDGEVRDGAWVAELTGDVLGGLAAGHLADRPQGAAPPRRPVALHRRRWMRLTCFATNTTGTPIAALELRHRQRARAEDRIRAARNTGLRNLPLHDAAQNQI